MRALVLSLCLCVALSPAARAQGTALPPDPFNTATCGGSNILTGLPPDQLTRMETAAAAQPYHEGNLWLAERDGQRVTLAGTYHLDDPRHDPVMQDLAPHIDAARTVLVEAGPEEEAALKASIARDPSIMILTDTSLPEMLPEDDWQVLAGAMSRRGLPPFMAAKFQPWYVTVLLSVPPCLVANLDQQRGLDKRVIERALANDTPVTALEPYDTVFRLFDGLTTEDQVAMIRSALAIESRSEDYLTTLADSYFAGRSRLIWELMRAMSLEVPGYTPERVDADLAEMERILLTERNQGWIAVIERAAADGPAFVAFGALHLSGATGVPQLLQDRGWVLTRLD